MTARTPGRPGIRRPPVRSRTARSADRAQARDVECRVGHDGREEGEGYEDGEGHGVLRCWVASLFDGPTLGTPPPGRQRKATKRVFRGSKCAWRARNACPQAALRSS